MKFTSKDLMKAMGLAVGDRVKVNLVNGETKIYEVIKYLSSLNEEKVCLTENKSLSYLLNVDFEILPRPKKVGDLKCDGKCPLCPCIYVCNDKVNAIDKTLYEVLELGIATFTKTPKKMNEEVHNVIKAILDKEVVEE